MNPDLLRVVLVSPRNPLNIGAAARAISNFGFSHLRLVNAYDVAFREARSAVNASQILESAREFSTVAEAISDCSLVIGTTALGHRELHHPLRRLEYGGGLLARHLGSETAALLFGSEKFGLSNADLSYCHWLIRIGTRQEHSSMNLGQAVAVCLYELRRQRAVRTAGKKTLAKSQDVERITDSLLEILGESGYMHSDSTDAKVRRLIRRMRLEAHDADVWLGIMRQIRWRLSPKGGMIS